MRKTALLQGRRGVLAAVMAVALAATTTPISVIG